MQREFHGEIVKHCKYLFLKGNYFHAVFEAVKAYNYAVKEKSMSEKDGFNLMMDVFSTNSGVLKITKCVTETDRNVQDGIKFLSSGLMQAIRNPTAHEPALSWPISKQDCIDILSFISFLFRQLDKVKPEKLNASQKNMTLSEILSYASIEDIKEFMIEKEVESVLRDSHNDQIEWLEKKLDIPLRKLDNWPIFIELTERRNLFVHCDGIISSQYLTVCERHGYKFETEHKVGDVLDVPLKYYRQSINCIYEIGIKLGQVMWRKLLPNEIEDADSFYNEVIFEFISRENYDISINLLEFALNVFKKNTNDQYKYYYLVNLAQSYKWSGKENKCITLMKTVDWSPLSYNFRLANAVLTDDYKEAASLMIRIGNNGEVTKQNYKEWPLFKKFRESKEFQIAFETLYGEKYKLVDSEKEEVEIEKGSSNDQQSLLGS